MKNAHENMEQIERYILQEMGAEEQTQFEQLLAQDEELAADVAHFADLLAGIAFSEEEALRKSLGGLKKKLQHEGFFEEFQARTNAQPENREAIVRTLTPRRRWLAIAASIVLVGVALYLFLPKGTDYNEVYSQNFSTENQKADALLEELGIASNGLAGQGKESAIELSAALEAYKAKKYKAAVPLFEAFLAKYPNDMAARFYFGISLMETGNFYNSIPNFETVIASGNAEFLQEAQWYQALSLLKIKAVQKKGVRVLEDIAKDKAHPYRDKAAAILKDF